MPDKDIWERILTDLGVYAVLPVSLLLILWWRERAYAVSSVKIGNRIDELNDKRVEEAKESAAVAAKTLDIASAMMERGVRSLDKLAEMSKQMAEASLNLKDASEGMVTLVRRANQTNKVDAHDDSQRENGDRESQARRQADR